MYGDGLQRRDLVHVDDVVSGLFIAWDAAHVGPLIIGAGRSVTVLDMIAAVERVAATIATEHVPAKTGEMPAVIVSIDEPGPSATSPVDLDAGLATVWDDLRARVA